MYEIQFYEITQQEWIKSESNRSLRDQGETRLTMWKKKLNGLRAISKGRKGYNLQYRLIQIIDEEKQ